MIEGATKIPRADHAPDDEGGGFEEAEAPDEAAALRLVRGKRAGHEGHDEDTSRSGL
jgi:hypothetical protein